MVNVFFFFSTGADDIVAITLGNILGTEITNLTKNGSDVYMAITVANKYGLWYNTTWAYALSFTFIGITAITMFYFVFLLIKRMYIKRQLRMQQVKYSVTQKLVKFTVGVKSTQIFSMFNIKYSDIFQTFCNILRDYFNANSVLSFISMQREMKKVAEKAIAKLQVRTLRTGDPVLYHC